jgi:hypothetical protein
MPQVMQSGASEVLPAMLIQVRNYLSRSPVPRSEAGTAARVAWTSAFWLLGYDWIPILLLANIPTIAVTLDFNKYVTKADR